MLLFLIFMPAHADLSEIGFNPFKPEAGSRPLGMGSAFAGLADDVNTLLYNPGGMAWAKGISLTLKDFENITAVQAYPTGYGSSLGLAVATTKLSNVPISGGTADSTTSLLLLSYGTKLNFLPALYRHEAFQRVGVGVNFKGLLGQTLRRTGQTDRSATGWEMDLGLLWKPEDWWSAGVTLQNLLPWKIVWDAGTPEAVPDAQKIAASAKVIGDIGCPIFMEGRELNVAGELDFSSSSPTLIKLGGEWLIDKTYSFRVGINQQITLGFGYRAETWGIDVVNYREPVRDEAITAFSVLYFPREWIVVEKLEVDKPTVILEKPFEQISLEDNIVTYNESLDVFGRVKPGVAVYINGLRAATADDNTFKTVVPLMPEKNLILVEVRYEGEKKTWKYKVLRKMKVQVAEEKEVKKQIAETISAQEKEKLKKQEQEIARRKDKVEELVTMGVLEVTPEAEFKLNASITRGELATWLAKAIVLRMPEVNKDLFTDVKRGDPLAPYIKVVVDFDLIPPYPDGTFRPNDPVSKDEAERLFRILKVTQR